MEYREMNLHQHILARPDTYVGSIREQSTTDYTFKNDTIQSDTLTYIPAILRLYVEALSNAIDNKFRSDSFGIPMRSIKIHVDQSTGETSVWNDGMTIPVEMNETDTWIPEMIFGRLLTSSNYNDEEQRYTSGRNGIGAKAIALFSTQSSVYLSDTKKTYRQTWTTNMTTKTKPKLSKGKSKGFTQISWIPDFAYFNIPGYTQDYVNLFLKYAYDTAMLTGLNVYFNDEKLPIKTLKDYAKLYSHESTNELLFLSTDECQVVLTPSTSFEHISFVNGVCTTQGGVHVETWCDAVFKPLVAKLNSKSKNIKMTVKDIKQHFRIFVNCMVPNPEFTSQSKTYMSAPKVKASVTSSQVNALMKWNFVKDIREMIDAREMLSLKKSERKSRNNRKIDGYDPANKAGGRESRKCTLILCEGLSAKTFAVTGIQQGIDFGEGELKGRNYNGILALRGKVLNVRNASISSIANNKEVSNIIQILGVQHGMDYSRDSNFATLRYGRILLIGDQDDDGFHIISLVINVIDYLFPTLLQRPGFLCYMDTPIVKIQTKNDTLRFYDQRDATRYISKHAKQKLNIKYYKGLGTSTDKDIRETFGRRVIQYAFDDDARANLNKVFHKDNTHVRKQWLEEYKEDDQQLSKTGTFSKTELYSTTISNYIDTRLIQFSISDCKRSIPHLMDGLKESNRKILYAAFLKNITSPFKVAQLAGFVAEKTNYHHGEQCLYDTITKMAQDFIGSNNLPLLAKEGQFGTLLNGGKDAANARYIFTHLSKHTRQLFPKEDDALLTYLTDEGFSIEPEYYVPVLPMILVNGCTGGIGTGWSCSIPCYSPTDLKEWITCWLTQSPTPTLTPWYNGFDGEIVQVSDHKFESRGVLQPLSRNKYSITSLPIGMWIDTMKDHLDDLVSSKVLKSVKNFSTPDNVHFELTSVEPLTLKDLKLTSSITTTNLVLFDSNNRLRKYDTIDDLLEEYCATRYAYYTRRKDHQLTTLKEEYKVTKSKWSFLDLVMRGELDLFNQEEKELERHLERHKLHRVNDSYDYLLNLSVRSFTKQKLISLSNDVTKLKKAIQVQKSLTEAKMWMDDLSHL